MVLDNPLHLRREPPAEGLRGNSGPFVFPEDERPATLPGMRTLSSALRKVYEAEGGYAVHSRARLSNDGGSTWTDLRTFKGRDFYLGASWTESVDQGVTELHLYLRREVDGWSLSPNMESNPANLVAGSYEPLLQKASTRVQVQVSISPLGATPTESTFLAVFSGLLVSFSSSGEGVLDCYCRDLGDFLMHTNFIEEEREYGSNLGTPLETVVQDILDDNGFSGVTLYTPSSPGWDLGRYKQRCEPVFTACETLAMQLGWVTRYHWDSSDTYRFTLWAPDRDATSPVYTLKECQRRAVPTFGAETDYIRNAVEIPYFDKADLDSSGQPKLKRVMVDKDYTADAGVAALAAASETAHGRRFMRYAPAAGANIDTQAEAERLGEAALKDLADAMVDLEVETPFLHFLQLGDLITVPADNVNHDTDLDVAVTVLRHALTADGRAATTLGLRGRPQGARVQWMYRMAHPDVTRPLTLTGPEAVSNVTVEETTEGTLVWFDEPVRGIRPFEYELHVYTSSGATLSASTLYATSRTNNFTVTSLSPDTTYYAKVVPRSAPLEANRAGNTGTASSEVTINPRYVEPRVLQQRISWGSLPLNGDFEANNDAASPPDTFTINGGSTWGTHAELTTSTVYSGNAAVHFPNTAVTTTLTAQPFTVREGEVWVFSIFYQQSASSGSLAGVLAFTYLDENLSAISAVSVNLGGSGVAASTWVRAAQRVTIPSGARFGEVSFSRDGSYSGTLTVDSVDALRAVGWGPWTNLSFQNSWADANVGVYGNAQYRVNDLGEVEWRGVILAPTPAPAANAIAFTLPVGPRPADFARVFDLVTTSDGAVRLIADTTGNVRVSGITAGETLSLDGIRYFVN